MIQVTKTFLPDFDAYTQTLKRSWDKAWITNNGELVRELEDKLKAYLGIENLYFTNNGTIVLQMALKALGITKEVITTPFSYVATTNAILWENATPIFSDIHPVNFCIDADKIERKINENTQAILATHVYGYPCDVEKIEQLALKYNIKVIYDAAHAFGAKYKGKSLLKFGDISTCSFHATKLFHTVEGGCIVTNDEMLSRKLMLYRQFGHVYDDYFDIGINAKSSEFHAAMGLCVLPHIHDIIEARKNISGIYDSHLNKTAISRPHPIEPNFEYNYAYYPIVFKSEEILLKVKKSLEEAQIFTRRYFYPSLNKLPFVPYQPCEVSEDISLRVLCLPLYYDLAGEDAQKICTIINNQLI